jgi:DNA-binding MarR family transcriptional regulator/GNAT superfamily N-acetyltransferase
MTAADDLSQRIAAVRRFNRFYTRQIGLLEEGLLRSPFSLTEARVIYELAQRDSPAAAELAEALGLDAGYLSRILTSFQKQQLITKRASEADGRQSLLQLTEQGRAAFAQLNADSQGQIEALLNRLAPADQARLLQSMHAIEALLGEVEHKLPLVVLRPPQPGDMGWVVQRHGALYAQEYGWNEQFEALVAEIVARFVKDFDPRWERCWIAEVNGENAGSIFLVKQAEGVAKLRLLLVEPQARGLGLGGRLVSECIRQARQMGYQKMTLWTNDVLLAARHIYQKAGFQCIEREPYQGFGHDLVSETWEMVL